MIYLINYSDKVDEDCLVINTTSRSTNWSKGLSPFLIKPIGVDAYNVENYWQFLKVYDEHVDKDGNPTEEWFKWRDDGFKTKYGIRYPMGKNRKPLYSYVDGIKYDYIEARKKIYIPIYAKSVVKTLAYEKLYKIHKEYDDIYLLDFDGYNHNKLGMSLLDVVNCESRKMGHAFVLKMLLLKNIKPYTNLKIF